VRSVNDQRVLTFMRNKVVELESKLKNAELELERLRSRPVAPFSQREEFLLGEMDLIGRQLQGWTLSVFPSASVSTCYAQCLALMQMSTLT
jgi:hypothetical protein